MRYLAINRKKSLLIAPPSKDDAIVAIVAGRGLVLIAAQRKRSSSGIFDMSSILFQNAGGANCSGGMKFFGVANGVLRICAPYAV